MARLLEHCVGPVDLENLGVVPSYEFLEVRAFQYVVGLDFIKGHLLIYDLVVGIVECFYDVNSLLYLPYDGLNGLLVGPASDGELVDSLDGL